MSDLPLIDSFGRVHSNLRIGVTDRCNIRCRYCMPEQVQFLPQKELLSFEEITRLVALLVPLGVDRLRLTGGEPLVRSQLPTLVQMLAGLDGVQEISLTTNAVLLADQARQLREAGLDRLNISLDTIDAESFARITRRDVLPRVLAGIDAAQEAGFDFIRINAVPLPEIEDRELIELAEYCRQRRLELRFIEFMPLDADQQWEPTRVRSGESLRQLLNDRVAPLVPVGRPNPHQPATEFQYADQDTRIGLINSVTQPFCEACNRIRVTSEGKLRNCLFSQQEWDVCEALRAGDDDSVIQQIRSAVAAKKRGHGSDDGQFIRPQKSMYQIGG